MGGTAISAFTTVQLTKAFGRAVPFDLVAVGALVYAAVAYAVAARPTGPAPSPPGRCWPGSRRRCGCRSTLQLSFLYAVASAASWRSACTCPPTSRPPTTSTAATPPLRTAGFVVLAVAMRPVGGWLSDRFDPIPVLLTAFGAAAVLAGLAAVDSR